MPADLWIDWTISASVEALRTLLPKLLRSVGYEVEETRTAATSSDWAAFTLLAPRVGSEPIGAARAQRTDTESSQLFLGAGASRDPRAAAELNRAAVHLYAQLVLRSLLAPPPPLTAPTPPIVDHEV
jgi:hypothetical protein